MSINSVRTERYYKVQIAWDTVNINQNSDPLLRALAGQCEFVEYSSEDEDPHGYGKKGGLKVDFDVTHHAENTVSYAVITIWNLNKIKRGLSNIMVHTLPNGTEVNNNYREIVLDAGYKNNHGIIFSGQIINAEEVWDGVDRGTRFYCKAKGSNMNDTLVDARTFSKNVDAKTVLNAILDKSGYVLRINKDILKKKIFANGYSISSSIRAELVRFCENIGVVWSLDGLTLTIMDAGKGISGKQNVEFNEFTGLIKARRMPSGMSISNMLTPNVKIGDIFTIKARSPQLAFSGAYHIQQSQDSARAGSFVVFTQRHVGNTHGNEWYTEIDGKRPKVK